MMRRTVAFALLGAFGAVALAACGERPQVVQYKQGRYQGKPDTPPYQGAPFNGDRKQYEDIIRTRNQHQNEYKRIG
jgi:hypothetical protein